jgi:hypothetical protein
MTPRAKSDSGFDPRKKYVKKPPPKDYVCSHCGDIYHYPVHYCPICKSHGHQAINGSKPQGCGSCLSGLSRSGQAHMRATRTWNGVKGIQAAYDAPEFYDGELEICNMTVMPIWIDYESGNAH